MIRPLLSGLVLSLALGGSLAVALESPGQKRAASAARPRFTPPRVWDSKALEEQELPLADPLASATYPRAEVYYRIPERPIYRSYPVYAPGYEPPGYLEKLRRRAPAQVFDPAQLKTRADWVRAGELVFAAPVEYGSFLPGTERLGDTPWYDVTVRNPRWHQEVRPPVTSDGKLPFYRYVVTPKGLELGIESCAMCHTRVSPQGRSIAGAQGNFPFDRAVSYDYRLLGEKLARIRRLEWTLYNAPWVRPDPQERLNEMSVSEIAALRDAIPPGVLARHRASAYYPVQVPDLFDLRRRPFLDRTGLVRHRGVADLMRYAALNQGGDDLARHYNFVPLAFFLGDNRPSQPLDPRGRYSDAQLYALALYIYSLKAPPNPNRASAVTRRGKAIFTARCSGCHPAPDYSNNQLFPAEGFAVPEAQRNSLPVARGSIGTDPHLTLRTRRGTGYYKVPSLRHLWLREMFPHHGACRTLEDWFDPRRQRDDYVPTGFRGAGVSRQAVRGHPFGLDLSPAERRALIAFLRTL